MSVCCETAAVTARLTSCCVLRTYPTPSLSMACPGTMQVKTPVMKLPLRQGTSVAEAEALAAKMRKLRLAECLKVRL